MLIRKVYKFELKPNKRQITLLKKHVGAARYAYNWALSRRIRLYQRSKKRSNAMKNHKILNRLKKAKLVWMYEVSKYAPQEAMRDLDVAYENFFREPKKGSKTQCSPQFKRKGY